MPLGTIIGISMIATGLILLGVVIWQAISYQRRQRDLQRNLDH